MGCNSSKSTEIEGGQLPNSTTPADSKDVVTKTTNAGVMASVDDAVQNLVSELTITEEKAKAIFAKASKNGQTINDELVALWEAIKAKKDVMKPRFQQHDPNDTGHVPTEEAVQILTKAFDGLPENCIRAMVKRYTEEDGSTVNYNQFVYFYANVGAKSGELRKQFDELDQDGSGTLAADEVCKSIAVECALEDFMARAIVDDFDLNKDGRVCKADLNDLCLKMFG